MHAIILWAPVRSEKTCIPLSPSFSVACSNSAFVYDGPGPHSVILIRSIEGNQRPVCVFLLESICLSDQLLNLEDVHFYSYLWVIGACFPPLYRNIIICWEIGRTRFQTYLHNHLFIDYFVNLPFFTLVCCLLMAHPGCVQSENEGQ